MRRTSLLAAAAVAFGLAVVPATARAATDTSVQLGMHQLTDLVVDAAHDHVYVTGENAFAVRDLAGAYVSSLFLGYTDGMALSPDGSRVYVAVGGFSAIAAIDTTTLQEVARYQTGDATCPRWLSAVGSVVWFGYGCTGGNVGLLDLSGAEPVVTLAKAPAEATGIVSPPRVEATPDGTRLLAASLGGSPSVLYSFTVAEGALSANASRDVGANLEDLALTPDGTKVVTAAGSPDHHARYLVADLAEDGVLGDALPSPAAVAATDAFVAAGTNASTGPDLRVYGADNAVVRSYELGGPPLPGGLAFTPDGATLYAVSMSDPDARVRLHVLHDPTKPLPSMTLNYPTAPTVRTAFTMNGTLTGPAEGATIHVTRSSATGTVALPDVVTGPGGAFSITDTVMKRGGYTYIATFDGDASWAGSSAGRAFGVKGLVPSLSVSTDRSRYAFHSTATVTARLATWSTRNVVSIYASTFDMGVQPLVTAKVDADGYRKVAYTITRRTEFIVRYSGDDVYEPRQVSVVRDAYAGLRTSLSGYYATSGAYRVYHRSVNPGIHADVDPDRYNACLVFEAQVYISGAWRALTSSCLRTSYGGEVLAALYGAHPVNVPHRIRATFQGDTRNLRTVGPWLYLRFTA